MNYVISVCIQKDIVYHGPLYHVTSLFHEHMEICPETRSQEYNYTPYISWWEIYYVTEVQFKSF